MLNILVVKDPERPNHWAHLQNLLVRSNNNVSSVPCVDHVNAFKEKVGSPDVIVLVASESLDLGCALKKMGATKILVIDQANHSREVAALEKGALDYLRTPFQQEVLIARVKIVGRKA